MTVRRRIGRVVREVQRAPIACRDALARAFHGLTGARFATVDHGIARGLRMTGGRSGLDRVRGRDELPVQDAIRERLRPGATFYDIGAHVGVFACGAAHLVGANGRAIAFEPLSRNVAILRRNLDRNSIGNVTVVAAAVAAREGEQTLIVTENPGGAVLESSGAVPDDREGTVAVPTVTIDGLIARGEIPPPDVVKLDVEGAELEALHGMHDTLRDHRPTIVYEVDGRTTEAVAARQAPIRRLLETAGYRIGELPDSYPHVAWCVRHYVAEPEPDQTES